MTNHILEILEIKWPSEKRVGAKPMGLANGNPISGKEDDRERRAAAVVLEPIQDSKTGTVREGHVQQHEDGEGKLFAIGVATLAFKIGDGARDSGEGLDFVQETRISEHAPEQHKILVAVADYEKGMFSHKARGTNLKAGAIKDSFAIFDRPFP